MTDHVFLTGFPGFISRRLVRALAARRPNAEFSLLVEGRMREMAEDVLREAGLTNRARCVEGDITAPWLGMGKDLYGEVAARTTRVWHLAALYDLTVPPSVAYRINVIGTANVLDLCRDARKLERFDYVSTCYVSGDRQGTILESELDEGQGFKNHYESTKAWAEMEVRRQMHRLPVAIHRPGIVVGDSKTGETEKYDGPYFLMTTLLRLPRWLPMLHVGTGNGPVNLVPVDFVVAAMAELSDRPEAIGQTFQLADPTPATARAIFDSIAKAAGFRKALMKVSPEVATRAVALPALKSHVDIPAQALRYFNEHVYHDTSNTQRILAGTAIRCPNILEYLPTLMEYVRAHPEKAPKGAPFR